MDVPQKRCSKCSQCFPATNEYFSPHKLTSDGLETRCKACIREKNHEYLEANREKEKLRKKKWREENPDRVRELDREWKAKYPEKTLIIKQRRAARKRNLPDTFSDADYAYMMSYWQGKCAICGRQTCEGLIIVLDHWIALADDRADNPGTVADNMIPLCHSSKRGMNGCNNRKWMLNAVQWVINQYDNEEAQEILERINGYFRSVKTN